VTVLWITAGLAGVAALLTLGIPRQAAVLGGAERAARSARDAQPSRSVFHGLVVIVRSPLLRGLVLLGMALAVVLAATQG
ncbi:hypothetical protein N3930_46940, partial [Bacillus thuringiensis]|nr:hypothetical protein [Bacillus thuringiensis]